MKKLMEKFNEEGSILIVVIVAIVLMASLGASFLSLTGSSTKTLSGSNESQQAMFNAQTGCDLYKNNMATTTNGESNDDGLEVGENYPLDESAVSNSNASSFTNYFNVSTSDGTVYVTGYSGSASKTITCTVYSSTNDDDDSGNS